MVQPETYWVVSIDHSSEDEKEGVEPDVLDDDRFITTDRETRWAVIDAMYDVYDGNWCRGLAGDHEHCKPVFWKVKADEVVEKLHLGGHDRVYLDTWYHEGIINKDVDEDLCRQWPQHRRWVDIRGKPMMQI